MFGKKPPRTFELATSNLTIGSGLSRALFFAGVQSCGTVLSLQHFCVQCTTHEVSIDYRDTGITRTTRRDVCASGSIQARAFEQFRQTLSRVKHACLHGVLGGPRILETSTIAFS